jgi:sugar phosphate isomerase/epimerase
MAADAHPDGPDAYFMAEWQANAVGALEMVVGWLDDPARLCIENVEAWNPDAFAPVLDAVPVSRTVDVGHLWLRGEDPLQRLASWIDRTRVVHLHGVTERDHKSLVHVPAAQLDPIVAFLVQRFTGVVTLEVFSQEDFLSSQAALTASLARVGGHRG